MVANERPVIERYFSEWEKKGERIKQELKRLVKLINNSHDEYNLQLRDDYFNIYYQGNSVAKVEPNKNGTYSVSIHRKFVSDGIYEKLDKYSLIKHSTSVNSTSNHVRFRVKGKDLYAFFQRSHLDNISSKIRAVHNGEEITMEQVIVTDNTPSPDFIIIDRQVADHLNWARADLLALKRGPTGKYHFVVIEIKLGRNPELSEKAGKQVSDYVKHISEHMKDYVECYQKNYSQKKELGLFPEELPDRITINEDSASVEGIVVACGYSKLAEGNIKSLKNAKQKNGWNIEIRQMPKMQLG
jgi:hypothetical protein